MSESDKPTPPADNECCESGCEPCVWDFYREELAEWQSAQIKVEVEPKSAAGDS